MTTTPAAPIVIREARIPSSDHPDGQLLDVLVENGVIARIGESAASYAPAGHRALAADGRMLLPGFVDAHSHADARIHDPEIQLALLRQGVTSVAAGLDGLGFAPALNDGALRYATDYFQAINGSPPPALRTGTIAEFLTLARDLPVRLVPLVPHGLLRYAVVGEENRPATAAERAAMCAAAEMAFTEGARGFSTGLEYVPGGYADERELADLCAVAARHGLPHVTHMRGYESAAVTALEEVLRLARRTGVASHISHLHGPLEPITRAIDFAINSGVSLTFDSYPYMRGCSILAMLLLPHWLPVAARQQTTALLRERATRERLLRDHLATMDDVWPRLTIASAPGAEDTEGMTLLEVAQDWGRSPAETAIDLLATTELRVGCVFEQPPTNTPESVRALANHPAHMAGSDSIYMGSHPHPRGWGTFAQFLHQHVIETNDWSWFDAVEHLSARASQLFGLPTGHIAVGSPADVVLIDPTAVRDRSTYAYPTLLAEGVDDVLLGGRLVLQDGRLNR